MVSASTLAKLRRGGGSVVLSHFLTVKSAPRVPSLSSFSSSISSSAAVSSAPDSDARLSSSSEIPGNKNYSRWMKCLLFLPGAIAFGLGTWQIFRRREKIRMLEYRQKRLQMEPLVLGNVSLSSEELDSLEFRKVLCKGVFDEKKSIFVGPRSRSISGVTENGYYVITPLMPIPNHPDSVRFPVLVNRGWVPRSWRDKSVEVSQDSEHSSDIPPSPSQSGEQRTWWKFWSKKPDIIEDHSSSFTPLEVVGVVRGSEKPSIFVPENDPNSSQWFYVDVPGIIHACGVPEETIYIEDINENVNPSNPYPIPKDVDTLIRSSVMPRDHLNYTLTWYSLSAAVTLMAFKRLRQKDKRRYEVLTAS